MNKKNLNKLIVISVLLLLFYLANQYNRTPVTVDPQVSSTKNEQIITAYNQKKSDIQVRGEGTVVKLLADDLQGSRHQRFLVKINDQQTLLIAHNIDLAPRIDTLQTGEKVEFQGEYVWNIKGGIIHWTHHDPDRRHNDGWIRYNNKLYK